MRRQWQQPRPQRRRRGAKALTTAQPVTKQRETRDRVLELIERLSIGQAIPSERQLSSDFGSP